MPRTPNAHALYMRGWNKAHRDHLRIRRQQKIAALLQAGVTGTRPCTGCGAPLARTAYRIVNRSWRCYECSQAWHKRATQEKYQARHPLKKTAHTTTNLAIRLGKLVRLPCEMCGNPKTQAHHDDYSKPLDVRWLCHRCHWTVHFPHRKSADELAREDAATEQALRRIAQAVADVDPTTIKDIWLTSGVA